MSAQLNIFDAVNEGRPCEYRFQRYIGQRVYISLGGGYTQREIKGTITAIKPYYTYVKTAVGELAGTPYNVRPTEDE